MTEFFIDRPIFAWVVSIVIVLIGTVSVFTLPIAQYPNITPPTVQVTASYPGASAQVVADSVAAPIEQQVNGVEGMLYMSSQCTNDGAYNLTVTFDLDTDLDMAQVLVQNRVSLAMPQLPAQVQIQGVSTMKKSPSILLAVNLISPDGRYDDIYLSNYATIQIKDELLRIDGVGDINYLGERDYSMRIWLDPDAMASRDIATSDIVTAVQNQNVQVAAGQIGQQPVPEGQVFQLPMNTLGRLETEEEFRNIIIKSSEGQPAEGYTSSSIVRVGDVGRVELGAQQYDQICRLDGQPSVGLAIFQLPGSNALQTAEAIKAKMKELSKKFPAGLEYKIVYDTTPFIQESVMEVFKTLRDAIVLVAIVVLLFLQDWKAMILPMIDVPVSLIGTFGVMALIGFSLNNLTLFGLVLAIGIVVDDAIVVLENVERQIANGLEPRAATIKAMSEITGPIIAITLVLSSVFIPSAFLPGVVGQFYRQFALTISVAMIISAVNAMTLTPSRAVSIFKTESHAAGGKEIEREALPWWLFILLGAIASVMLGHRFFDVRMGLMQPDGEPVADVTKTYAWGVLGLYALPGVIVGGLFGWFFIHPINRVLGRFFRAFNRVFDRLTEGYSRTVRRLIRASAIALVVYGGLLGLTIWEMGAAPKGFIPIQDQGYLLVNVQLPDSASVQRTLEIMNRVTKIALGDPDDKENYPGLPGVAHTMAVSGQSILLSANASNFGSAFIILKDFPERTNHDEYDAVIAEKLRKLYAEQIDGAEIDVFRAPPIQGLGTAGGFKLMLEQRGYVDLMGLGQEADEIVADASTDHRLVGTFSMYRADTPQLWIDIDRTKCESLNVATNDVFNTFQVFMGGYFVNLFNRFGRTWQVNLMADPTYRTKPEFVSQLKVRNKFREMVPLGTLSTIDGYGGPVMVCRYNMYTAAPIVGNPAPGTSSGDVMGIFANLSQRLGFTYEWTEIMFLQQQAGNVGFLVFGLGALLVFLVLAAKYESWKLPLSVILVVPMCLLCSVTGMLIARMPVDIFVQIGFLVLVGMAAKNAVLIVEFAKQLIDEGQTLAEATVEACKLRLRPIIMTSFAFILGVVPLVVGHGAGAEMRNSLGTAVFSGMIGVTFFGIFLTPIFFYSILWLDRHKKQPAELPHTLPANADLLPPSSDETGPTESPTG
ncbi:MAG: efflux RND transporter permease subunit [Pirellulales bacterium]|nr:efflux RND transporter permease subunit [Pirellulales bacterium]